MQKGLIYLGAVMLFMVGCTTTHRRILSQAEMSRYNLHGVVNEAPICPTQYDSISRTSKIIGPCEKVTCEKEEGRLICTVERK